MNYNIEKFLISIKKWISSIEEVIVDKFIDLENKLDNKTEKVRIDIVDTDNNGFAFKKGEDILNFKELNDLLQNSPDFLVFVYSKREHRCTMIDMDSNPKQMRFVAPMLSDNRLKTQSFYVTSLDGVEITSITRTDINCENSSNKVTEITESNKNSNTYYPTVKAVSDKLDEFYNKTDITNIEYSISMALNQLNERLEILENNSVTISQE